MGQNTRIIATRCRVLKSNSLCFLLLLCIVLFSCGPEGASEEEMAKFMEHFAVQHKQRKQELTKLASAPLSKEGQKLLTQLLDEEGSLDVILSSKPYLAYLEQQVGTAYEDFADYVAAMPTSKRKSTTLFGLKTILPSKATAKEIQHCLNFYFKLRELFTKEPDIIDKNIEKLTKYQLEHFNEPLMAQYSKEELLSKFPHIMQLGMVPTVLAGMETQVFHEAWHKRLETHGLHEGLLRCAIVTPDEFALVRAFVENTEALEKWILEPLKPSKSKKKAEKSKREESQ